MSSFNIKKNPRANIALKLNQCLAKTFKEMDGSVVGGRDVFSHCRIVGLVARSILSRFPQWLRKELFPLDSELVAAAHDIGKVCPSFQEKIRRNFKDKNGKHEYEPNSLRELEGAIPEQEESWGWHAGLSQLTAKEIHSGKFIPEILGQHHGYSPQGLCGKRAMDSIFGGKEWQTCREELIDALKRSLSCDWPMIPSSEYASLVAGLTSVSDWIGSGSQFDDPKNEIELEAIEKSLNDAGFISPKLIPNLTFKEIFNDFEPRPIQQQLIEVCKEPGIYILEAPMGIGKTEAALYAAYKMMTSEKTQARGIYFALPTQLTSDKIHDRVNPFLKKILTPDSQHQESMLIHSNARLKITEMGEEGKPSGSWFQQKKRSILAPFGVGTVDQALMAVMNVKYGFVRAFGLAGKVVILDEVHSYDSYTGTILDVLINTLRQLKCTVIILSATLTQERRQALLSKIPKSECYPLISSSNDKGFQEIPVESEPDVEVDIRLCQHDAKVVEKALLSAEQGQQVLWIENTVEEAQNKYKLIAAHVSELGLSCGLLHSRFLKVDRKHIEEEWVSFFGKEGIEYRKKQGRILVGTQVLEQSLDIDADFLITRMCPTDMLLQRLGRLWRHQETKRPPGAKREAWILSPSWDLTLENPKEHFGKSALVYSPYVLLRSLEVWNNINQVLIPSQMKNLIESTYQSRKEEGVWRTLLRELEGKKEKLARFACRGLARGGVTLEDDLALTRYSDQESVDVLLIKEKRDEANGIRVRFLNNQEVFLKFDKKIKNLHFQRKLAVAFLDNTVSVPEYLAPRPVPLKDLDWVKDYLYIGKEGEKAKLRVAIVGNNEKLLSINGSSGVHPDKILSYNEVLGYIAHKKE